VSLAGPMQAGAARTSGTTATATKNKPNTRANERCHLGMIMAFFPKKAALYKVPALAGVNRQS